MFRLANVAGRAAVVVDDRWHDLAELSGDEAWADPMAAVARHRELHRLAERAAAAHGEAIDPHRLGPCVPRPSKVFGIGINYRRHAEETGATIPTTPLTFTKFPSCLAGPTADIVLSGDTVDWEVELVVAIGSGGRHIPTSDVWAHVAGVTLGQDVSDRTVQMASQPPQFSLGKSFDGYGPIGPTLVSVDAFVDPDDIGVWCDVSGERMQDGRTSDLIFSVPELVAYLSSICTLQPGDLIFTGTPSGVGAARGRFLRDGDVVTSGGDHLGPLVNRVVGSRG